MIHKTRRTIVLVALVTATVILVAALNAGLAQSAPQPPETLEEAFGLARPEDASRTRLQGAALAPRQLSTPSLPITLPSPAWRIGIVTDGLYMLDHATLISAGVNLNGVHPDDVHLLWRGQDVSLDHVGMEDGTIDPGDTFVFYGEKFHGTIQDEKYTDENVYWLAVDDTSAGVRMATRGVTPTGGVDPAVGCVDTVVLEENNLYWGRWTTDPRIATTWFWEQLRVGVTRTFELPLSAPVATEAASMTVSFASKGDNTQNSVHVSINDTFLGTRNWNGMEGLTMTVSIPSGLLQDGSNTVQVVYDDASSIYTRLYFDKIVVTYTREPTMVDGVLACSVPVSGSYAYTVTSTTSDARVYDVSDTLNPVRLVMYEDAGSEFRFQDTAEAGDRYWVEAPKLVSPEIYTPALELLSPSEGADYIVIAPGDFLPSLQPLVAHREGQGLRVRVVPVEDIYPLFNGGIYHPEAIRAFVAYAHQMWPGDPFQYLFLVGDGHMNFKTYNPATYGDDPIWIPPYLEFDDPTQGEIPLDSRYGDINGDGTPEVYVGRLPAETVAQVQAYVAKLLAYESEPMADWHTRALLIADNGETYDEGFDSSLDRIARPHLDGRMNVQRLYMEDYNIPPVYFTPFPTYTQAIVDAWNAGAAMVIYAGHASITRWAHEPILYNTDLVSFTEKTKLPFLLSLDCWDGYYMFPTTYLGQDADARSFGEWVTTVLTDSGAIANFAPAGLSFTAPAESVAKGFMSRLAAGERRLGPLTQAGRTSIPDGTFYSYLSRSFTLLGDPAMELKIMYHRVYLPLAIRNG